MWSLFKEIKEKYSGNTLVKGGSNNDNREDF